MRLLVVKLGAIGDIIHALPAVADIRRRYPDARVSWLAERRSGEILRGSPLIDRLIEIDSRPWRKPAAAAATVSEIGRLIGDLRREKFDLAIDFQGLLKSSMLARASGAREIWGFSPPALREPASRIFYNRMVATPAALHVINKNLMLARAAAGIDEASGALIEFPIAAGDEHRRQALEVAARAGGKFAILNPAGGWVTKLWPAERFGRLARRLFTELGLRSVIAVSPHELALADRVLAAAGADAAVIARPTLKGFFELARLADVYVGGDTGPTHLAVAAGTPIVGIFGPTEWWRNGSLNPDDICVERRDIGCRTNCHRRECSAWICLDIDVETVFESVSRRLAAAAKEQAPLLRSDSI